MATAEYAGLSFDQIAALTNDRLGKSDITCPLCSVSRSTAEKKARKVFRVWRDSDNFITFHCVHCGEKGWLRAGNSIKIDAARLNELKRESAKRDQEERLRRTGKARAIWKAGTEITGTLAERYLREVRGIRCQLHSTLRFLPASRSDRHAALVGAYGIPIEPEPGRLHIEDIAVRGVQLTLLAADGTKAKNADGLSKIAIGRSLGFPIVAASISDSLALAICEGLEDALSIAEATGMGAWASTGAKKLAALAPVIPPYIEALTIFADADNDGRTGAEALASAVQGRDCEIRLNYMPTERAAA